MTSSPNETSQHEPVPSQLSLAVGRAEEEIGARLRHQRLKRRLSIEDAARGLRLASSILEQIERGELQGLAAIYRRGYVRNYARFLGLEPEPLLELLDVEELPALRPVLTTGRHAPNFDKYLKFATYAIVTTLIIPPLAWFYVQGGSRFMERDPVAMTQAVDVAEDTGPAARNSNRIARALALEEGEEREASPSYVSASALPLVARPVRDPAAGNRPADPDALPPAFVGPDPDRRSVLMIELLDDSWLEVYGADGRRLEYDLLRAGERREFRAEPPFRLLLGRANAVALELDGMALSFDGQDRADLVSLEVQADGRIQR